MSGITDALTGAIGDAGVYAVFLLMLVDAILPAGSEIVMLYAGALAAGAFPEYQVTLFGTEIESSAWAFVVMAMAGTLGYWVGSMLGWAIGLYGGRPLVERHGRWLHLGPHNLHRAERWFERHGDGAVFWSRIVPVVRSFIAIPAGVVHMPFGRYALLTLLGTLLWCFGFAGAGYALGPSWEEFHDNSRYADYVIAALIVAALGYVVWRVRRARRRAAAEESM